MYPTPNRSGATLTIGEHQLAPGDYLNYKRIDAFGETVYSGCYIIDVAPDEGTVELFSLHEETRVTHTARDLEAALGELLVYTGKTWTEPEKRDTEMIYDDRGLSHNEMFAQDDLELTACADCATQLAKHDGMVWSPRHLADSFFENGLEWDWVWSPGHRCEEQQ